MKRKPTLSIIHFSLSIVLLFAGLAGGHDLSTSVSLAGSHYNSSVTATYSMTIPSGDRAGIVICADGRERFGPNVIVNGDMELDSDWADHNSPTTNERSSTRSRGGTYSRHIVSDASGNGAYQNFSATSGQLMEIGDWVYIESVADSVSIDLPDAVFGSLDVNLKASAIGSWQHIYGRTKTLSTATAYGRLQSSGGAAEFYVDDAVARQIISPLNGIFAEIDRTTGHCTLIKRVASVETTLIDEAVTYGDGYKLIVVKKNDGASCTVDVFYNGLRVGTQQTISDAKLLTGKVHYSTGNGTGDFAARRYGTTVASSDPMTADLSADWSKIDCTLIFDTDHYEVNYTADTQHIHRTETLESGAAYEFSIEVKDGTLSGVSGQLQIIGDTTYGQKVFVTTGAWQTVTTMFIAADASERMNIYTIMGGAGNIEIRNYQLRKVLQ